MPEMINSPLSLTTLYVIFDSRVLDVELEVVGGKAQAAVRIMSETERNIDCSSTVVGRASTPAASNQTTGMRDRASCALCFNLDKVAPPLTIGWALCLDF
jgi:hypothetical protein